MKNRSELRNSIIKILYQIFIYEEIKTPYQVEDIIQEELEIENDFVKEMVHGILEKQEEIKQLANQYLVDWEYRRLSKVDQAILALGIYELKYTDTPSIVAINEAVELSKSYSDEKVTKMINGVLDTIYHSEEGREE